MNQRILRRNKLSWTSTMMMCRLYLPASTLNPKACQDTFDCRHTKPLSRKLTRLEKGLKSVDDISTDAPERSMIQQCSEQLSNYKRDLTAVYEELLSKDINDDDELATFHSKLERTLFDISQRVKHPCTRIYFCIHIHC